MKPDVELFNLVCPPEPEIVSFDELRDSTLEGDKNFGSLDFHTAHTPSMADPFDVVAEIERKLGAPLALCRTTVIGASK